MPARASPHAVEAPRAARLVAARERAGVPPPVRLAVRAAPFGETVPVEVARERADLAAERSGDVRVARGVALPIAGRRRDVGRGLAAREVLEARVRLVDARRPAEAPDARHLFGSAAA